MNSKLPHRGALKIMGCGNFDMKPKLKDSAMRSLQSF